MKSMKALLMGFVVFYVNDKRFWRYQSAHDYSRAISAPVFFQGFSVWRWRWLGFLQKT